MTTATAAETLLELLFWSLEKLSRPTVANLTESFEAWEYRIRFMPGLRSLARSGHVTFEGRRGARTLKLTERGRVAALGAVDPVARWQRKWDGKWRLLVFDLPTSPTAPRTRLWRWLRSQRFGYLQQSVWISPDPVDDTLLPLMRLKLSPESLTVIEGRPTLPDRDSDLVRGSWEFGPANSAYRKVIECCGSALDQARRTSFSVAERRLWLVAQRKAWLEAVSLDPLLPEPLLPADYLGLPAWNARTTVFGRIMKGLK